MTITYLRDALHPKGHAAAWSARLDDDSARVGIGPTRTDALASLVRLNLAAFGIDRIIDIDPTSVPERVEWWVDPK